MSNTTNTAPEVVYVEKKRNGMATASLVVGIIAISTAWVPFLNVASMILAVIAIGLGIGAFFMARKRGGMVKTAFGVVLSIAALVLGFTVTAATVDAIDEAVAEVDDALDVTDEVTVELGAVTSDEFSSEVPVTITNISDETGSYWVTVVAETEDGATQIDTTQVIFNDLKAGQSATDAAMFLEVLPEDAVISVADVM
jgi:hypothetical protein